MYQLDVGNTNIVALQLGNQNLYVYRLYSENWEHAVWKLDTKVQGRSRDQSLRPCVTIQDD